ncbi:hypothetical protein AB5J72_29885 [Streptomyces sp. CG1]|uniref:hypothetical protein n=1 Tax=Streptomyces sp. CG1 TaxID=1287523 RepID=UPI0034E2A4E9
MSRGSSGRDTGQHGAGQPGHHGGRIPAPCRSGGAWVLAAAGQLLFPHPGFVRGRAEFVASCLVHRGLSRRSRPDLRDLPQHLLITGDHERVEAAPATCAPGSTPRWPERRDQAA